MIKIEVNAGWRNGGDELPLPQVKVELKEGDVKEAVLTLINKEDYPDDALIFIANDVDRENYIHLMNDITGIYMVKDDIEFHYNYTRKGSDLGQIVFIMKDNKKSRNVIIKHERLEKLKKEGNFNPKLEELGIKVW